MIPKTATRINFRTDAETKRAAEELFNELGLDMSTALNMFLKQAVRDQALPIQPKIGFTPNEETQRAIDHTNKILSGKIHDDSLIFSSATEAAKFLEEIE
ncbi:RelB/DinJ family addiction module antitoxin [Propionimicrobium lymphophilum ACS-093-V-SCH5]|uniref:RelB/DinJ family addiction module antitoxin n=1 Tax=Propionimicrobium lymphophilum ACS-093-V-SCH5 TaxID=883161 RepID=S2WX35_9ACTN|nr:type II toxin-antitoxin system RelB/DinJ family antitoxin [Propionimicrobium lymphophilum]EPD32294.1 RelB/DinJ family addiction module antitoxin [Propionimicrobium lymphophilum ACS-093-V-SCH5]